jgi:hypothetical protein
MIALLSVVRFADYLIYSSLEPSDESLGYSQASALRTQKFTSDPVHLTPIWVF